MLAREQLHVLVLDLRRRHVSEAGAIRVLSRNCDILRCAVRAVRGKNPLVTTYSFSRLGAKQLRDLFQNITAFYTQRSSDWRGARDRRSRYLRTGSADAELSSPTRHRCVRLKAESRPAPQILGGAGAR